MKNRGALLLFVLLSGFRYGYSQDPHFSQYINTPFFLNPAHAGNGIEHLRATLIYRSQWSGFSPYKTQGFMIDKKVGKLGFGFQVVNNGSGKAGMNKMFLSGTIGYNLPLSRQSTLSAAIQLGMIHSHFNPENLTFDNQYIEDVGFDPAISSGEIFSNTSISRPDASFGLMWQRGLGNRKLKFRPFGGVSFSHVNRPAETFIIDQNKLPVKQIYQLGAGIMVKENLEIKPQSVVVIQDHFHEIQTGAVASFLVKNYNKFQAGIFYRNQDAVILYTGYQVNSLFIGTSYDINISSLKQASSGKGGFELTLSYIPKAKNKSPELPKQILAQKPVKKEKIMKAPQTPAVQIRQEIDLPEQINARETVKAEPAIIREVKPEGEVSAPENKAAPETPSFVEAIPSKAASQVNAKKIRVPDQLALPKERMPKHIVVKEAMLLRAEEMHHQPAENFIKEKTITDNQKAREDDIAIQPEPEIKTPERPIVKAAAIAKIEKVDKEIVDTDGDGIRDDDDECPYIRGSVAAKGCPDSDGDGIIDSKDRCPMEPGPSSNSGCPVRQAVGESNLIRNFNNIEFETGKAKVKTADIYDIIEYAIDVMYEFPGSRIILSGHTDSEGDALSNMKLSEMRNEVVKRYLIRHGINENRIQTINYGETMPLTDNRTEEGKARNRRVEINIIRN